MTRRRRLNPKLTTWLNERGFVSGDWPNNLPESVLKQADRDIGKGATLDERGREIRADKLVSDSERMK